MLGASLTTFRVTDVYKRQIYNRAIALKQEGDYQSAIDLFTLLGDYLSSADQAVECKMCIRDRCRTFAAGVPEAEFVVPSKALKPSDSVPSA